MYENSGDSVSRKPRNIKLHNQRLVASLLQRGDVMTASEISEQIRLSKTTVTKIIGELHAAGIVKSVGKGESTEEGGKKPELFALNETYRSILVLSFGVGVTRCAVMDLKCTIREQTEKNFSVPGDYAHCVADMARVVTHAMDLAGIGGDAVCAVVCCCEGIVDAENGVIQFPVHNRTWGRDLHVRDDLAAALPFPARIIVDNGCRLSGYAETAVFGDQNVAVLYSAGSSGGCLMERGHLMQGTNGFAGEIGHIVVDPSSRERCSCGGYGCFETLVSPQALVKNARELLKDYPDSPLSKEEITCQSVFDASNRGDALAHAALERIAQVYAILIHDIILLFDPQVIVLQGMYTHAGEYFLQMLRERVNEYPFYKIKRSLRIVYSRISDPESVIMIGGAMYAVSRLLLDGSLLP